MAVQVDEPRVDEADLEDWHKILNRTTFQGGGFMKVSFDLSTNPTVVIGSRLEVGGAFYYAPDNEEVEDSLGVLRDNEWVFIYAVPHTNAVNFIFDYTAPVYDDIKVGWYNEESRAVARIWKGVDTWNGLLIFENKEIIPGLKHPVGTIITMNTPDNEEVLAEHFGGVWQPFPFTGRNSRVFDNGFSFLTPFVGDTAIVWDRPEFHIRVRFVIGCDTILIPAAVTFNLISNLRGEIQSGTLLMNGTHLLFDPIVLLQNEIITIKASQNIVRNARADVLEFMEYYFIRAM